MLTDIEIARNANLKNIKEIAKKLNLVESNLELYGNYKAKLKLSSSTTAKNAKLILVTAINPTSAGEGKTTVSIGLADALSKIGKKTCLALREPSLGPVFGVKGGATGGGYAQVAPMEDINLHFTGDMHAITSANNLLCALIDNHIFQGNTLNIDKSNIYFNRCMDMNERQLINITVGGKGRGIEREDHFTITAASEIMAILCLAINIEDLKNRIGNIIIGLDNEGNYVKASQIPGAVGSMAVLLKDAMKPNLVQTLEHTPAIIHGGPFANIAHGCNSIQATYAAMQFADYAVTEAGFGADLGAEKFLDVKCRIANIQPSCVVLVATVKALKLHGGADKSSLSQENLKALKNGIPNLIKHIENIKSIYKKPVVVAINSFATDTRDETNYILEKVKETGTLAIVTNSFANGSEGSIELAHQVVKECEKPSQLEYAYDLNDSVKDKITKIATKVYGANEVLFSDQALDSIIKLESQGYGELPIIIAKTQYSLSDDPELLGAPKNFSLHVEGVTVRGGAGFILVTTGKVMLMPGLGKKPAAENIDLLDNGEIVGLF